MDNSISEKKQQEPFISDQIAQLSSDVPDVDGNPSIRGEKSVKSKSSIKTDASSKHDSSARNIEETARTSSSNDVLAISSNDVLASSSKSSRKQNLGQKLGQNLALPLSSNLTTISAHGDGTLDNSEEGRNLFLGRIKNQLLLQLGENIFNSWFNRLQCDELSNSRVVFSIPTLFLKRWISSHYLDALTEIVASECKAEIGVQLTQRNASKRSGSATPTQPTPEKIADSFSRDEPKIKELGVTLNGRLTLSNFIVDEKNKTGLAATQSFVNRGKNGEGLEEPIYIYGDIGRGKTHLLQGAAHELMLRSKSDGRRVIYLTADRFMHSYVSNLRSKSLHEFESWMQGVDVLIVDDLQFLKGASFNKTFCNILQECRAKRGQILIAADRPVADLEGAEERLKSRLNQGLTIEIGALEYESRLTLLQKRIEQSREKHLDFNIRPRVVEYIAREITTNGRDLDGAFNRMLAYFQLTRANPTMEVAVQTVKELARNLEHRRLLIDDIQTEVVKYFSITRNELLSTRRTKNIVLPRQIGMYLAKTMTNRSLPEIGRKFGDRDHTTVLHAVRKIKNLVETDRTVAQEVDNVARILKSHF